MLSDKLSKKTLKYEKNDMNLETSFNLFGTSETGLHKHDDSLLNKFHQLMQDSRTGFLDTLFSLANLDAKNLTLGPENLK